jgi:TonB-dependent SusC/RagA subfamily outer membrane receptor
MVYTVLIFPYLPLWKLVNCCILVKNLILKKLQLILTNPCSKRWDDMQQASSGRYCDSCEKHIVDLTRKSDTELIRFFTKKKDNICGRLLPDQLNRELVLPPSRAGWQWLLPLAAGTVMFTPAQANELRPVVEQHNQAGALTPVSIEQTITSSVLADTIRGRIVDNMTGKPLKGVKVRQAAFENVLALTDADGKFKLSITDADLTTPFTFELIGYFRVRLPLKDGMEVKLSTERNIILGGISSISLNQEPMYLIYAGKKSCTIDASRMREIPPDWIEKLEVLKDAKATALYGAKAANGIILIEIKKAYAKKIDFSKKKK